MPVGYISQSSAHAIPLADKSVHCVVTSPPYFGLRMYAGRQDVAWIGGSYSPMTGVPACIEIPGPRHWSEVNNAGYCQHEWAQQLRGDHPGQCGRFCQKCSAWKGGFGSEPTPEMYVWHTILVLRELRRVLRDDGVVWWNVGDAFSAHPKGSSGGLSGLTGGGEWQRIASPPGLSKIIDLAQGNLIGIPHRVMLALQADGWIVRNDLIWHKIAPMPESVGGVRFEHDVCQCVKTKQEVALSTAMEKTGADRHTASGYIDRDEERRPDANCKLCGGSGRTGDAKLRQGSWRHTRAHEFVFMLCKDMKYWSDGEIVKETTRGERASAGNFKRNSKDQAPPNQSHTQHREDRSPTEDTGTRNPRSVLSPSPSGYSGPHYAVFPPDLIRPLVLASTPRKCCPHCGRGWSPLVERGHVERSQVGRTSHLQEHRSGKTPVPEQGWDAETRIVEYRQTCECPSHNPVAGIVYDPFFGSGTTGIVARELGLNFVGTDISHEYLRDQAQVRALKRTPKQALEELPMFAAPDK